MARRREAQEAGEGMIQHLTQVAGPGQTLPTKAQPQHHLLMAQNIAKVYARTSPELRTAGENWYPGAHQLADRLGKGDVVKGAGLIAALSPNKGWAENQRIAARAATSGRASGHTTGQVTKAQRILDGEHPESVLGALKERSFYHSIVNPDGNAVAVDRHAHDIAMGQHYGQSERGLQTPSRYAHFEHAYNMAADHVGMPATRLQAITWTGWRGAAE